MTEEMRALAAQLTEDLELAHPPVQISYLDAPPRGVAERAGAAPSVCTYFAEGRQGPFYAGQAAHEECEVGAFVLGIPPEGKLGERVMGMVGLMQKEGYLEPGEEARIPRNSTAPKYVAYGPLGTMPVPPTNVLLFASPKSAMLVMEAAHGPVPMNGRPMCAIVPTLNQGAPVAVSIGCIGSRIYTEMGDSSMIVGIRGDHLVDFARSVRKIRDANQVIGAENRRRKNAARAA